LLRVARLLLRRSRSIGLYQNFYPRPLRPEFFLSCGKLSTCAETRECVSPSRRETVRRRVAHQGLVASALLRVARSLLGRSGSAGYRVDRQLTLVDGKQPAAVCRIKALWRHPRRRARLRGYAWAPHLPSARLRGWDEETSRLRPSPSNPEYCQGMTRITHIRDQPPPSNHQFVPYRP
jgi:hypothetical protein